MKHYVIADKPGTESLVGAGGISFVVPDLDLAVELADWLSHRGWKARLTDSNEVAMPRNTQAGRLAVEVLVQQFAGERRR